MGGCLAYASVELRADRELVLIAIVEAVEVLEYASAELLADRIFMIAANY